jgi:Skp family chaperone for outer membrane proteins
MFFFDLFVFSILIDNQHSKYVSEYKYKNNFFNGQKFLKISNNIVDNKIGIIDFRYILKSSNAMKLLGNKFLSLEKEINQKFKQKQIYLKQKEESLKKSKTDLTELVYKNRVKLFKKEVFNIQKKHKDERALLNKSFQKIQKDIKDLLAQIIKEVSLKKNINIVLLKENVFLFNNKSFDFTDEVLKLFNDKTKSMKIIINSPK